MKIKAGQVYTFNNGITYDIINHIDNEGKIWYQIIQIKDLAYFNQKLNRYIIWSRALPNNEGTFVDMDYLRREQFEKLFKKQGKLLGVMNVDFGLNEHWHIVPIKKSVHKWEPMDEKNKKH